MFLVYTGPSKGIVNLANYDRIACEQYPNEEKTLLNQQWSIYAINQAEKITLRVYSTQQEAEKTLLNLYIGMAQGKNNWDMTMQRSV